MRCVVDENGLFYLSTQQTRLVMLLLLFKSLNCVWSLLHFQC